MKKILLHAILIMFCAASTTIARAQEDEYGFFGGISIPNLTSSGSENNPLNTGYSSRLGPEFGIMSEHHITRLFSLEWKLEYSSQGGKKDGFQAFPTPASVAAYYESQGMQAPDYLYANFKSEVRINYLRFMPVMAKFGWDLGQLSQFRLFADAGPFVGYLLSAKQVTSGNSNVYADPNGHEQLPGGPESFDNTENIKDQLHHGNFGVDGDVGIAYKFGKDMHNKIFLEAGWNYGFINIQKGSQNGKNNTGAATVLMGYTYKFKFGYMHMHM